ncbi:mannosyl-3-phosphoglycerate phosphatase-related protein [Marinomonas epiphytica]
MLVFTDLDGTLLDHHTYSFEPAIKALEALKKHQFPCILNTSKTYAELQALRVSLNHQDPFIVENGSAVYIPKSLGLPPLEPLIEQGDYWVKSFGPNRDDLITLKDRLQDTYQFLAFSDMTPAKLIQLTGLDSNSAELALQREFTEPLYWQDTDEALTQLKADAKELGIHVQKGGRFAHLMGAQCDKANAMLWLSEWYSSHNKTLVTTMALGDGENDIGMLEISDLPVIIRSPSHPPPKIPNRHDAQVSQQEGPAGWCDAVFEVLTRLKTNNIDS